VVVVQTQNTHEVFVHGVRKAAVARALKLGNITPDQAERLTHTKLVYGVGTGSYRGICIYNVWENGIGTVDVIEIAASAEESWVQLLGTTIHELGHVLAGNEAGHGPTWKAAADKLGLKAALAAGHDYKLDDIESKVAATAEALAKKLGDGSPAFKKSLTLGGLQGLGGVGLGRLTKGPRPCSSGIGTRGGTSRGNGSGSRLRLWECTGCEKPQKVRVASDVFEATHSPCGTVFVKIEKGV
jgi:hypothetical protein